MNYSLYLYQQFYWKEKARFDLRSSRYPSWVMFAVEKGDFRYRIESTEGKATAGDVVICPPNTDFHRVMEKPLSFHYFKFYLNADGEEAIERTRATLRDLFAFKFTPHEKDRFFNNLRHLTRLSARDDAESIRWKNHFVNDIWLLLSMEAEMLSKYSLVMDDPLIKQAKLWIDQHLSDKILIKDVAEMVHLHPVQFNNRFQNLFGTNPSKYLLAVRMETAKRYLLETDYTIDHIARLCGYDNGFYMSRVFSKHFAMSPSQYRKTYAARLS
ncbi:helix-turn-helix domain-containing protein [Paenibacillus ginsengarvi]|uniref:AraC family transcriptional regulator n=1 Tax=Paenibacillus ginsengarvi TaxID=400777 RepID=A0A3B0BSI0_9BACL|nr:AraC family transcriptional regulator [Paenibacillus ginsengarvi]RKN74967.1 AraC family transcriptional regulator [Paenibacillus ginsengarvi]